VLLCYQTLNSGFIGAVGQSVFGIPAIVYVRGNTEYRLDLSLTNRLLAPRIYRRVQRVIVQSPRIQSDLRAQFEAAGLGEAYQGISPKVTVLPNGIELKDIRRSVGTKIVYVGRLIEGKGVSDLLSAVKNIPGAEALIVGDGPQREELVSLAEGLPVVFAGRVEPGRVADYLKDARLLVLPSRLGDGLPNVILEAMSCGVPVVTTNTAGMPDVVKHEETGLLYHPGNVPELTGCIRRLLHDDVLWEALGERSLEAVRSYSWDVIAPQIEQLLGEAIPAADTTGSTDCARATHGSNISSSASPPQSSASQR
jgi:glycosyltransferase involved in cell wall biosynthesis